MTNKQLQLITAALLGLICLLVFAMFRQQQNSNQNTDFSTGLLMHKGMHASDNDVDKRGIVSEGDLSDYLNEGTNPGSLSAPLIDPELFNILLDIEEPVSSATSSKN